MRNDDDAAAAPSETDGLQPGVSTTSALAGSSGPAAATPAASAAGGCCCARLLPRALGYTIEFSSMLVALVALVLLPLEISAGLQTDSALSDTRTPAPVQGPLVGSSAGRAAVFFGFGNSGYTPVSGHGVRELYTVDESNCTALVRAADDDPLEPRMCLTSSMCGYVNTAMRVSFACVPDQESMHDHDMMTVPYAIAAAHGLFCMVGLVLIISAAKKNRHPAGTLRFLQQLDAAKRRAPVRPFLRLFFGLVVLHSIATVVVLVVGSQPVYTQLTMSQLLAIALSFTSFGTAYKKMFDGLPDLYPEPADDEPEVTLRGAPWSAPRKLLHNVEIGYLLHRNGVNTVIDSLLMNSEQDRDVLCRKGGCMDGWQTSLEAYRAANQSP